MYRYLYLLIISAILLTSCQFDMSKGLDAAADAYKAISLSDSDVQAMAVQTKEQLDQQTAIAPANSAYAKRLSNLTRTLVKEDGLALNFKVYMTKDINAFALPDGSIRVYSGLMDLMKDDNELFFVIGHEVGHVKLGHSANRFRMAYAASAGRKAAGAVGGTAGALAASELGDLSEAFINAQFSQSQESDSDMYGLQLLKKYNKNTKAAVTALQKLAELGGEGSLLSSHPDPQKRAETMSKAVGQ